MRKQKFYRSFVAEFQFAATLICFDFDLLNFAVYLLARFCASAGSLHWAALHHIVEFLEAFPSFKLIYLQSTGVDNLLSVFADSYWGNSASSSSNSGNCLYNRSPVPWLLKLQLTTTLS
jgi:hypothetical protein